MRSSTHCRGSLPGFPGPAAPAGGRQPLGAGSGSAHASTVGRQPAMPDRCSGNGRLASAESATAVRGVSGRPVAAGLLGLAADDVWRERLWVANQAGGSCRASMAASLPPAGRGNRLVSGEMAPQPRRRWRPIPAVLPLLLIAAFLLALLGLPLPLRAEFSGVDYTLTNQNEQDFSGQDLSHTSFAGAQGRHARFHGADLHGAILTQGAFPEADFSGADLSDVLMDKVDFHGADFRGALLRGVIASGSSFQGALVTNADFSDALLDRDDLRSLCRDASGSHPVTGVDTRASLGCG